MYGNDNINRSAAWIMTGGTISAPGKACGIMATALKTGIMLMTGRAIDIDTILMTI